MTDFLNSNLNYLLLGIIVVGGLFITKYTPDLKIKDSYKILCSSLLFSIIFYFLDGCGQKCINSYLFTYLFATSFYELIVKYCIEKLNSINFDFFKQLKR
ncbi:hypothetical protein [Flavobacterium oreochromis]|uniref:Uncharacterized protein n=1 Tax=Flavobacterium columnare TaxID=996 RepID=A0A2D0AHN6_9FLAO|nr:hypothetical protein [Flavobacterium oreochromis]OWP75684.1 hypothetical protein BWK62_11490 [Flavobacterium oreochromis]OWP78323.1 hypothetical protein BWG23_02285 [Flavobacterium oreochromis]POR25282.1 hypothetical protein BWK58_07160 [Flavobacterium columnare]QYS85565.1 hypothetical protein JJC03_10115 [Flavobacterium oreochromis]